MLTQEITSLTEYTPIGSNREACLATEQEVILGGPLGTGKTRALLEKVHRFCNAYHNVKVLLLRKRAADLAGSALEMFRDHVARDELAGKAVRFVDARRDEPARYEYHNGSVIVIGGLWPPPQKTKVTSSSWDIICVIAATELDESDWELLLPLCHNGAVGVNQLIGECEPLDEDHWIQQRAARGHLRLIEGQHEDNPRWFQGGMITREGVDFIAKLDALTGVTKLRNRYGFWVKAAGMCWPSYDRNVHLINPIEIPYSWPLDLAIDFGKVHPFALGVFRTDERGRGFLTHEIHMTGRETEEHCYQALQFLRDLPVPRQIITDHAANDRLIVERMFRQQVTLADKRVLEGIDYVEKRWRHRRLFIFKDALVEVDESLRGRGHPINLDGEIPRYVWAGGKRSSDGPIKKWDDSCDMTRYWVMEQDAPDEVEVSW